MIKRKVAFITGALFSTQILAFPCIFTLVKDSCWTDFNVTVVVTDVQTNKPIMSITAPKGKSWQRQSFECQPGQKLVYSATFNPVIWEGTEGRVYHAQQYWSLPESHTAKQAAWEIPVCYPAAFSEVPLPATGGENCRCDFLSVPAIPTVIVPAT